MRCVSAVAGVLKPTRLNLFLFGVATGFVGLVSGVVAESFGDFGRLWATLASPVFIEPSRVPALLSFNWIAIGANPIFCYLIAAGLAWRVERAAEGNRALAAFGAVMAMITITALFLGLGFSRLHWGYYLARPQPLDEIHDVVSVASIVPVEIEIDNTGVHTKVHSYHATPAEKLPFAQSDPYYCLDERLMKALDARGLLPQDFATTTDGLPPIQTLLEDSGWLADSDPGYNSSGDLRGTVLDTRGPDGERLVFLGMMGHQVSNDHYPYYELLFSVPEDGAAPRYLRGQRFFFDVAGIEGMAWFHVWFVVTGFGWVLALPITAVAFTPWGWLREYRGEVAVDGGE